MSFYHQGKPSFYRYECSFELMGSELTLYLETDKKEKVIGLYYEWDGDKRLLEQFSQYAPLVEGRDLNDIPPSPKSQAFPFAFTYYRRFVHWITEGARTLSQQKNEDEYGLICRCAGIYESEIRDKISQALSLEMFHSSEVLRYLGDELLAGVSCGTCLVDLNDLITQYVKEAPQTPAKPKVDLPLWQTLDPQSLAKATYDILQVFMKEKSVKVMLLGTKQGSLLLKVQSELTEDLKNDLTSEIESQLGAGLEIIIK